MNIDPTAIPSSSGKPPKSFAIRAFIGMIAGYVVGMSTFIGIAWAQMCLLDQEIIQLTVDRPEEVRNELIAETNRYIKVRWLSDAGRGALIFAIAGAICSCSISRRWWITTLGSIPIVLLVVSHGIVGWKHYQRQLTDLNNLLSPEVDVSQEALPAESDPAGWRAHLPVRPEPRHPPKVSPRHAYAEHSIDCGTDWRLAVHRSVWGHHGGVLAVGARGAAPTILR